MSGLSVSLDLFSNMLLHPSLDLKLKSSSEEAHISAQNAADELIKRQ